MDSKRTVTVELLGHRLTVRTTENEEALTRNVDRLNDLLVEMRSKTGVVDTARLFALALLHLGREIDMTKDMRNEWTEPLARRIEDMTDRIHRALEEA